MPYCGVHYLWFAFVCFVIGSHPPLLAHEEGEIINPLRPSNLHNPPQRPIVLGYFFSVPILHTREQLSRVFWSSVSYFNYCMACCRCVSGRSGIEQWAAVNIYADIYADGPCYPLWIFQEYKCLGGSGVEGGKL